MPSMGKIMREFKASGLHSGSKHGQMVKNRKQAIGMNSKKKGTMGQHADKMMENYEG